MDFRSKAVLPFRPMAHVTSSGSEPQEYKPELSPTAKDQMTVKWTVGDRRLLEQRARAANQTPTRWLVSQIQASSTRPSKRVQEAAPTEGEISVSLDKRRLIAAEVLADQFGFHDVQGLAEDLLRRAVESPDLAEKLLFANLRTRSQPESDSQKKAA